EFIEITKSLGNLKYDYHTYGYVPKEKIINLTQHGKFNRAQVKEVYQSMDLIIVPSQWKETFGLIVVEALSFGRPVLVSDNVGSKDCVGLDFTFQNIADIENKISRILKTNQRIKLKTLTEHAQELIDFY
uniref:glycosyltransferase n=1 Tax=Enterococcus faecium TaxID=1352 RepID=UPI0029311782